MLQQKLLTKQDLIRLIQSVNIKKIFAEDIHDEMDISKSVRAAKQQLRSNLNVTIFVIAT